jgi:hypothetical protein
MKIEKEEIEKNSKEFETELLKMKKEYIESN